MVVREEATMNTTTDKPYTPYVPESDTSRAAAEAKAPTAETDAARVLDFIRSRGAHGATDDEAETALGMLHQNASARRRGLFLRGLVVDSGARRNTRSGRKATVWTAKAPT
jgi:hypothetical protein